MANEKKGLVDITTGEEVADANSNGILDLTSGEVTNAQNTAFIRQSVAGPLPGTVDQQQLTDSGGSGASSFWQSLTPGTDSFLVSVTVKNSGGPVSGVTLEIFNGEGDGGTLLSTTTGLTINGVTNLVLSTPVAQTSGSKLTWKISGGGPLSTRVNISGGYPGGISSAGSGIDAYFQTFESSTQKIVKSDENYIFTKKVTTVNAATYDVVSADEILHVTYTSTGAVTSLTLPTSQAIEGRMLFIKDAAGGAGTYSITIDTQGSEKIDGEDTLIINNNYGWATLYSDGTNWLTLS